MGLMSEEIEEPEELIRVKLICKAGIYRAEWTTETLAGAVDSIGRGFGVIVVKADATHVAVIPAVDIHCIEFEESE